MEKLDFLLWIRISKSQNDFLKTHFPNRSEAVRSFIDWAMSGQRDARPSVPILNNRAPTNPEAAQKMEALNFLFEDLPQQS